MSDVVTLSREDYKRLLQTDALFRQLTDSAPVLIWLSGTERGRIWFNPPWLAFRGRSVEEETESGWTEGIHPDERENCMQRYRENFARRMPFRMEYRLRRFDGVFRWMLDHSVPRLAEDGTFLGYIGTCLDVTEIHEARHNSAKHQSELAAIVESSNDVILSKDLNGIITSWNAAATRVFGYNADEMIGTSILKLIPEHLHADEKIILDNIRRGHRMEHFETVRLTKSGDLIDVSLTVSPMKDEQGMVIGASKILRDISDRKRIEQSLLNAEKIAATGRMAATIAHEINNPLEAVMNLLYLLRPMIPDPIGQKYLETAESEMDRVSHIAKQTLGYYREHTSASRLSLCRIAQLVAQIYEPRCTTSEIGIGTRFNSTRELVLRRGEVMQVISNLVTNSLYAMPSGGLLSMEVDDLEEGVLLTVRDNGCGIAPEHLPRVYEPFFTTRHTIGTGIGLFIAKQFVEGHGGTIHIESSDRATDHGTTVKVFLPWKTSYETAT